MKKYYYLFLVEFVAITAFFTYYLYTNPLNLLQHFKFLSPDGDFFDPPVALIKLYLLILVIILVSTALLFTVIRNTLIKFHNENIALTWILGLFSTLYLTTIIFSKNFLFDLFFEEDGIFEYILHL